MQIIRIVGLYPTVVEYGGVEYGGCIWAVEGLFSGGGKVMSER